MVKIEDYGNYETAWCPGCGNHSILKAVKQALVASELAPHQVLFVSGIGQAAKAPHYLNANVFNGLHGRSLPVATGAKLASHELVVIAESGDGCNYGEGGNHFLAAARRNINVTLLAHNNLIYGLTKGQASPTTPEDFVTKAQPKGVFSAPFNPLAVAISLNAGFVARGYAGMVDHLAGLIREAVSHRGFSLVDILQPCVSFNHVHTYKWFKERVYEIEDSHDPSDRDLALKKAFEWGERIPLGVIYKNERLPLEEHFATLSAGPLKDSKTDLEKLGGIMEKRFS